MDFYSLREDLKGEVLVCGFEINGYYYFFNYIFK